MDLSFLSEADNIALKFELAKTAIERAKQDLEQAKFAYDNMLAQAEAHGIPKAKLKKLTEDRVQALFDNGIVPRADFAPSPKPAPEKKRRPKKEAPSEDAEPSEKAPADETVEDLKQ